MLTLLPSYIKNNIYEVALIKFGDVSISPNDGEQLIN